MRDHRSEVHSQNGDSAPPSDALREVISLMGELGDYVSQLIATKVDSFKLSTRKVVAWSVIGIIALLAGATMVIAAVVLLLNGLAEGLAVLLGGRMWAGNLIVGFVLLAGIALGLWIGSKRMFGASFKATVKRYERRLQRQRVQRGHDARQRSAEYSRSR